MDYAFGQYWRIDRNRLPGHRGPAVETERLEAFLYVYINTWMAIEIAYENGMLPRATFDLALDDVRLVLQYYPALRPLAREIIVSYPSEAYSNVYAAMREELEDID